MSNFDQLQNHWNQWTPGQSASAFLFGWSRVMRLLKPLNVLTDSKLEIQA